MGSAETDLRDAVARALEEDAPDGDLIQISTAPGSDGIVRRIAIKAKEAGSRPDWIVFALKNDTNDQEPQTPHSTTPPAAATSARRAQCTRTGKRTLLAPVRTMTERNRSLLLC